MKFTRRSLLLGASIIALSRANAGINNPGSASLAPPSGAPTGRVVLNLSEPAYYNNFFPWLDILKNSEGELIFQSSGGTKLFTNQAAPGGVQLSSGVPSCFGVCCDINGQFLDMSVNAPTVANFNRIIYLQSGSAALLPPTLAGVSYTLMFTAGIGATATVNGTATGSVSVTATTPTTTLQFTMPTVLNANVFLSINFNGNLSTPPQNIHCIPTAFVATFDQNNPATMINPAYISMLSNTAGILRAMGMQSTNVNFVSTSIDTIPTTAGIDWSFGQFGVYQGCPLAILAQLAIQSNKHLWFSVPALFIGPKTSTFNNTNSTPYDPAKGAFTAANPCVFQPIRNQPFVNGDPVLPWSVNFTTVGGAWGRIVKCQSISSSVFNLASHNFVNGQLVRLGCDLNDGTDSSTYPTGSSKLTYYYICNVVAGVSFQLAQLATPSTPITLTGTMKGPVNQFGAITSGSAYTNGTYTNVPMTGGTGTLCLATVVVSGGAVTSVIPNYSIIGSRLNTGSGSAYTIGDSLSALAANIGGTGSGFSVLVGCVDINVQQSISNRGNTFTVAGASAQSFQLSGPGSDTSFYGCALSTPSINVGASTFSTTSQIGNGLQIVFGTLDGVFADQTTYPTGVTKGQTYFVVGASGGTFQISTTRGGSAVTLSGSSNGTLNFYLTTFASAGSCSSPFNLSWFQTQLDRVAQFFKTALAGTSIKVFYELGNEIWGGSQPGLEIGNIQSLALGFGVRFGGTTNGYMMAAMADQLYTSYGGDKTKYQMLCGSLFGSLLDSAQGGITSYLTAVGSSRTVAQLFDYIINAPYYGSNSRKPNSSAVTATFATGTPGTLVLGGGTNAQPNRPYKFHATAGALPTGLSENTTYWLSGSASPWNIAATPNGSPIALSGALGTYTAVMCQSDINGELIYQSMLLGPGPIGNSTNPDAFLYYNQSMRQDSNSGQWTGLNGPAGDVSGVTYSSAYSVNWNVSAMTEVIARYLAPTKFFNGLKGLLPYEGGDNNNNISGYFGTNQASGALTATISGTTLTIASITGATIANGVIGMDITGPGVTASTIVVGIRNDLGSNVFTVNNSQTSSPTGWASTTVNSYYLQNMFSDTYAQTFVDSYNTLGTLFNGYTVQFLDVNPVAYGNGNGTYGMLQYIGQSNPRLTWVQYVNNLP